MTIEGERQKECVRRFRAEGAARAAAERARVVRLLVAMQATIPAHEPVAVVWPRAYDHANAQATP